MTTTEETGSPPTPGDDTQAPSKQRTRRRVLPDGDYAIFAISDDGTLQPIAELGKATFATEDDARRWLRQHGAALVEQSGQQLKLAIMRFRALLTLQIQQQVKVAFDEKPRHPVNEETGDHE